MKAKLLRPLPRVLDEKEAQQQLEHLDVETCAMKEGGDRERSRKKVSKVREEAALLYYPSCLSSRRAQMWPVAAGIAQWTYSRYINLWQGTQYQAGSLG